MKKLVCPKCKMTSGNDWSQCGTACPMVMSPHYKKASAAKFKASKKNIVVRK